MIQKKTFTNAILNSNYQLKYEHDLNTSEIIPKWFDENGIERSTADLFQIVDSNSVILNVNGEISGTHTLLLYYESSTTTVYSGKRLFEQDEDDDPSDLMRLAMGKADTATANISLSKFRTYLFDKLSFLKKSKNLSDVTSAAKARSNLSVYSQTQVDESLAKKATLFQENSGYALGTLNTSVYNPTGIYNPATLRNVYNIGFQLMFGCAVESDGTADDPFYWNTDELSSDSVEVTRIETGKYKVHHSLGNVKYYVFAYAVAASSESDVEVGYRSIERHANYFYIYFSDDGSLNDIPFEFFMFRLNTFYAKESS